MSQLNSKNNSLGLLFKTILWHLFCFLSFVATDGKDGNGLKLEKFRLNFSSFDAISTKNTEKPIMGRAYLTLSVPVVLINSPNWSSFFSLNKFERILLLILSSLLCLINSHFLITKCLILYLLCKEKLGDNWLGMKGLKHFIRNLPLTVYLFVNK